MPSNQLAKESKDSDQKLALHASIPAMDMSSSVRFNMVHNPCCLLDGILLNQPMGKGTPWRPLNMMVGWTDHTGSVVLVPAVAGCYIKALFTEHLNMEMFSVFHGLVESTDILYTDCRLKVPA